MMGKIDIKGVAYGCLTSFFGSLVIMIFVNNIMKMIHGVPVRELYHNFIQIRVLVVYFFSMIGGFVSGRVAKQAYLWQGGATGVVCVLISIIPVALSLHFHPLSNYVPLIPIIPLALAGSFMAKLQDKAKA